VSRVHGSLSVRSIHKLYNTCMTLSNGLNECVGDHVKLYIISAVWNQNNKAVVLSLVGIYDPSIIIA